MRFIVVTAPGLVEGFRLAGVEIVVGVPGGDAAPALLSLAVGEDVGLVLVTDDVWRTIPERVRGSLESRAQPIVIGIPAGLGEDVEGRRTMLGEALQRAMGHRISLSGDARPPGKTA